MQATTRLLALLLLAGPVLAQERPADLEPVPEPPPMPEPVQSGEPLEPDITIIERPHETVVEYRQSGRLRAIKVVPKNAPPYYLVDADGDGRFENRSHELGSDVWVNAWVLFSWQ